MIRGNLKILVLKALEQKPLSGYALMKFIEDKIGTKPSPGSMYPLLDDLTKESFVTCKKEGRKKIYSLTKEGKNKLKELAQQKETLIKRMEDSMKLFATITGQDLAPFKQMTEALKKGTYSIEDIPPEVHSLKIEMARIFGKGLFQKNKKKVKEILSKSIKELKKLK